METTFLPFEIETTYANILPIDPNTVWDILGSFGLAFYNLHLRVVVCKTKPEFGF